MPGAKAPPCAAAAKNPNAGTGCIPAPASGWITAARRRADARSLPSGVSWPRARGSPRCASNLHAEALRRGLGQAAGTLVIGAGAVWIWRLADDRWPQARQRLDFYHAVQHLAAVGRALFGEDKERFKSWFKPLVKQLKNQSAVKVIRQLAEVLAGLMEGPAAEVVTKEVAYFHEHQDRLDYRAARRAREPIGRGPVEATCRQAQRRFKRPGQFWSRVGDEALLCLERFWRNDRWHLRFPHTAFDPARN